MQMIKFYFFKFIGEISKADKVIRPCLKEAKIYLDTVGVLCFTCATIFVAYKANALTKQQIELENTPIFYVKQTDQEDHIWNLMEYYIEPQLYYNRGKLQLDLFFDFDNKIFEDQLLYYFLGIDLTPQSEGKLQEIQENTNGDFDESFADQCEDYIDGLLDDSKQIELFSDFDDESIRYIINKRFINELQSYNNWYLIRNEGAPIVIYESYPFAILEIDSNQFGRDNIYFVIDDCFDYAEYGENRNEFFIKSRSNYFSYAAIKYLEENLSEYFENVKDCIYMYPCIGLTYNNSRLYTEWYTIEKGGLKPFEFPITKLFPNKDKDKIWKFGESKYSFADIFDGIIEEKVKQKWKQ